MTTYMVGDAEVDLHPRMAFFTTRLCRLFYVGAKKKKITEKRRISLTQIIERWNDKYPDRMVGVPDVMQALDMMRMSGHKLRGDVASGYYLDQTT